MYPLAARAGAAGLVARWTPASVVNAGDGKHEHPTQALLDLYTLRRRLGRDPRRAATCGSSATCCTAAWRARTSSRSRAWAAAVTVCGPPDADPARQSSRSAARCATRSTTSARPTWSTPCACSTSGCSGSFVPSLREYAAQYQIDARRLGAGQLLMHPGPVNRGVELSAEVIDSPQALITDQVESGVVVRMAVLYELLTGGPVARRTRPATRRHTSATARMSAAASTARPSRRPRCSCAAPTCSIRARASTRPADLLMRDGEDRRACGEPGASRPRRAPRWSTPRACTPSPAFVDPHVHLRTPGPRGRGGHRTRAPAAAAAGGYCAILAMPNTEPVVDSALGPALAARARRAPRRGSPPASLAAITRRAAWRAS